MNRRTMLRRIGALIAISAVPLATIRAVAHPALSSDDIGELFLAMWRRLSPQERRVMKAILVMMEADERGQSPNLSEFSEGEISEAAIRLIEARSA